MLSRKPLAVASAFLRVHMSEVEHCEPTRATALVLACGSRLAGLDNRAVRERQRAVSDFRPYCQPGHLSNVGISNVLIPLPLS